MVSWILRLWTLQVLWLVPYSLCFCKLDSTAPGSPQKESSEEALEEIMKGPFWNAWTRASINFVCLLGGEHVLEEATAEGTLHVLPTCMCLAKCTGPCNQDCQTSWSFISKYLLGLTCLTGEPALQISDEEEVSNASPGTKLIHPRCLARIKLQYVLLCTLLLFNFMLINST